MISALTEDSFLYVHYPYCSDFCRYCIYKLHRYTKKESDLFLRYYRKEISQLAGKLKHFKFKNIHIGGGTPNLIDPERIIEPLKALVDFSQLSRFVLEIFPRNDCKEYIQKSKRYGVTKMQLGVQTLNDDLLHQENRLVDRPTIEKCLETLSRSGILFSVDMIYGFENEKEYDRDYISELNELLSYHPSGLHLYTMRMEQANRYYTEQPLGKKEKHTYRKPLSRIEEFMRVQQTLLDRGYRLVYDEYCTGPNVDHAKRAISYNEESGVFPNIVGIGLGAYTHTRNMRYRNVKNLERYARLLDRNKMPIGESSDFSSNHLYPISMIYNQVRKGAAVDLADFAHSVKLSVEEEAEIKEMLTYLKGKDVAFLMEDQVLRVTPTQYSKFLYTINEYVEGKTNGTYSFILD